MSQLWPSDEQVQAASDPMDIGASSKGATVFVRNLAFSITDSQLASHFEDIGPIKHAFVARERHSSTSRGFGFVEFSVPSDAATAARKFNGSNWLGRSLKVEVALKRNTRVEEKDQKIAEERQEETRQRNREKRQEKSEIRAELRRVEEELGVTVGQIKSKKALEREEKEKEKKSGKKGKRSSEEEEKPVVEEKKEIVLPSGVTHEHIATSAAGRVVILSGFTEDVAKDRILASMRRLAPVQSILYPAPESLNGDLTARVTFETAEAAEKCVKRYNNKTLRDCRVRALVLTGVAGLKAARLIVRNVGFDVTEAKLQTAFEKFGRVLSVNLPRSPEGYIRGFAFVQMDSPVTAEAALTLTGSRDIGSRPIAVDWALSKEDYVRREQQAARLAEAAKVAEAAKAEEDAAKAKAKAALADSDDEDEGEDSNAASAEGDEEEEQGEDGTSVYPGDSDEDEDSYDVEEEGSDDEASGNVSGDDDDDYAEEKTAPVAAADAAPRVYTNAASRDVQQGCSLFIRNLSYDTTEDALAERFAQFGRVRMAKVVKDKALGRSMGTAFVQFFDPAVAASVVSLYGADAAAVEKLKKDRLKRGKAAAAAAERVIKLDGRDLIIALAVDRSRATEMTEVNKKKKEDKRNMYLAREGVILPDTAAAEGVSKGDLEKRQRAWKEKRTRLQNPNFCVSATRLSVRNIPLGLDAKQLKKIFLEEVQKTLRAAGRKAGGVTIKQAKVVVDKEKLDVGGRALSRGFGFIEFAEHEHALLALRATNNNPTFFRSSIRRPIVEFALDDARKMQERRKLADNIKNKNEKLADAKRKAAEEAAKALGHAEGLAGVIADVQKRKERKRAAEVAAAAEDGDDDDDRESRRKDKRSKHSSKK